MGRIFLILVLFVAATDADLRARAQPYLQWGLDPLYEQSIRWRLRELAGVMERDAETGNPLPTSATLAAYLAARGYDADAALDPWGGPLSVQREYGALRLASPGPDGVAGTADDVRSPEVVLGY